MRGACLREAAFALEVPRALNSDAPVIAALNLLFQPPPSTKPAAAAPPVSEEIDLIIGPLPKSDPLQLIQDLARRPGISRGARPVLR